MSFVIDSEIIGRRIVRTLKTRLRLVREPAPSRHIAYYDTFDWRLYRDGGTLTAVTDPDRGPILTWATLDGEVRFRSQVGSFPAFAWDLPPSSLRTALERVIEMRRLLPQVELDASGSIYRVLDASDKTVVKIVLESAAVGHSQKESTGKNALITKLRIVPVRGYDRPLEKVTRLFQSELGTVPSETSELVSALAAVGRTPGDYTNRLSIPLERGARSDVAAKRIQKTLLENLVRNEEGTRLDLDSEFVHDFRVSLRRSRAALSQIKDVFEEGVNERFRRELSWLATMTGPTRDLDVYLLAMPAYRASLGGPIQKDLDPLDRFLQRRKALEQTRLVDALASKRYRNLLRDFRRFIEADVPPGTECRNAMRPIEQVLSERVRRLFKRSLKKGRRLLARPEAERFHALRLDCKKLRYLLEFSRSLCKPERIKPAIKLLKRLQDNLGTLNDLRMQQDTLRRFSNEMFAEGTASVDTLLAMGMLLERLAREQDEAASDFESCFRAFASKDNRSRFRHLLSPASGPAE